MVVLKSDLVYHGHGHSHDHDHDLVQEIDIMTDIDMSLDTQMIQTGVGIHVKSVMILDIQAPIVEIVMRMKIDTNLAPIEIVMEIYAKKDKTGMNEGLITEEGIVPVDKIFNNIIEMIVETMIIKNV